LDFLFERKFIQLYTFSNSHWLDADQLLMDLSLAGRKISTLRLFGAVGKFNDCK
jgi:hypothetical protein